MHPSDQNQIRSISVAYHSIIFEIFEIYHRLDELQNQISFGINTNLNTEELIKQRYVLAELQYIARNLDTRRNKLVLIYAQDNLVRALKRQSFLID